ncbi:uncharacterized protein LOC135491580 [Lineus longissimus]|uniref:uncharacterized protein LOC135491580 n=1 Tax=Lineus longissimus TaxID=88925 RepID=UPI00315CE3E2
MSHATYMKIPEPERPVLVPPSKRGLLTNADGGSITYYGKALFWMDLGPLKLEKPLLVADIEDEVLLGADILQRDPYGPADILLSQNRIMLKGQLIPLKQIRLPITARRVRAADHFIIPAMSEVIIQGLVDRANKTRKKDACLLIEANPVMVQHCNIAVAPTLVDATKDCTVPVRVMNPFEAPVSIKQDMVIGVARTVGKPKASVLRHESGRHDNNDTVRRIQMCPKPRVTDRIRAVGKGSPITPAQDMTLPKYLQPMLDGAKEALKSPQEETTLKELILEFSDIFSKDDADIGRTHLVEHEIDTGDAKPFKQAPRKVPMAFAGEELKSLKKMLNQGIVR